MTKSLVPWKPSTKYVGLRLDVLPMSIVEEYEFTKEWTCRFKSTQVVDSRTYESMWCHPVYTHKTANDAAHMWSAWYVPMSLQIYSPSCMSFGKWIIPARGLDTGKVHCFVMQINGQLVGKVYPWQLQYEPTLERYVCDFLESPVQIVYQATLQDMTLVALMHDDADISALGLAQPYMEGCRFARVGSQYESDEFKTRCACQCWEDRLFPGHTRTEPMVFRNGYGTGDLLQADGMCLLRWLKWDLVRGDPITRDSYCKDNIHPHQHPVRHQDKNFTERVVVHVEIVDGKRFQVFDVGADQVTPGTEFIDVSTAANLLMEQT